MRILFLIVFLDVVGFGIIIPVFPFIGLELGASAEMITFATACYAGAQFIAAPIWGRLSDRFGRKPIFLVSLVGSAVSYVVLGFAETFVMLVIARLIGGITAGNISAAYAYAADVSTNENRAKSMGVVGAAFGVGFIIGPALGGLLAGDDPASANIALPAFVAAALSLATWVATLVLLPESYPKEKRAQGRAARDAARFRLGDLRFVLIAIVAMNFLMICAASMIESSIALWANDRFDWGPREIGLLFLIGGLVGASIQGGALGLLRKRFSEVQLLVAGVCFYIIGTAILLAAPNQYWLFAAMPFQAIATGLYYPCLSSLASQQAGPDNRGGVLGIYQAASSLGRIAGPLSAGPLFTRVDADAPLFGSIAFAVSAGLTALVIGHGLRARGDPETK